MKPKMAVKKTCVCRMTEASEADMPTFSDRNSRPNWPTPWLRP
jgi:hypothetical protein